MSLKTLPPNTPVNAAFYAIGYQKSPNPEVKGKRLGTYSTNLSKEDFKNETRVWAISTYEQTTVEKLNTMTAGTEDYFEAFEDVTDPPF